MRVFLSKPRDHWISPYTMLDYVFFWTDWSKCARDRRIRSLEEESKYPFKELIFDFFYWENKISFHH